METTNVVCCPDNNYAMPTGVMLCSLCENNRDADLFIHVVYLELSAENVQLLKETVETYQQRISFYKMEESSLPNIKFFSGQQKLPISTYIRLFIASILPNDIQRVLYLDGDIIVNKAVKDLFRINMEGHSIAAVPDDKFGYNEIHKTYNALKYPPSLGYFNAGVLMINLEYWRENDVEPMFVDIIKKYMSVLYHNDQDVLNKVFCESKLNLPLTYNFLPNFIAKPEFRMISWEYNKEIDETAKDPVILHFTGSKPWNASCDHPYQQEFHKYKAITVWKKVPLQGKLKWEIRKTIKKICMLLRIPYNYYHIEWAYSYSDLKHD